MDPLSSCRTVLVPTTTSHKARAAHTLILMSRTRPLQPQPQRPLSGPLCRVSWGLFLSIREKPFIFPQVYVVLYFMLYPDCWNTFLPESYGGHYGPVFNEYIESQNAKAIPGAHNISLETVLIGNGWYNPLIQVSPSKSYSQRRRTDYRAQYQAYYNFTVTCPFWKAINQMTNKLQVYPGNTYRLNLDFFRLWQGSSSVGTDAF